MGNYRGKVHKDTGSLQHLCQGFQGAWNPGSWWSSILSSCCKRQVFGVVYTLARLGWRKGWNGEEGLEHYKQQDLLLPSPFKQK